MSDQNENIEDEATGGTEGTPEEYTGPTIDVTVLRNGDFPKTISLPEGSTGSDLTNRLLNEGMMYDVDPSRQTFLDDNGHGHGPSDTLTDGLMVTTVQKLAGAAS